MKVLVACEFSGIVRDSFLKRGHDAWSCDLVPSLKPGPHIQGNVLKILNDGWDVLIAHPPCDRLLVAGALHWKKWRASGEQQKAIKFFMRFAKARVPKVAIENPIGIMSTKWRKPDQVIQPYQFGHTEQKATCLWLIDLPKLVPTSNVYDEMMKLPKKEREKVHYESPGVRNGLTRSQRRSIFYQGFADAMAEQWV
jgi:hypothetical protein